MKRAFDVINERVPGGVRRISRLTCSQCGANGTVGIQSSTGVLADQGVLKKFQAMGWDVGRSDRHDKCPACKNQREKKMVVLKDVEQVASAPRTMGIEERRIVFEKLNEVYLNAKQGYADDWSDHRVATDLGVPRKWIEDVRKEFFGPLGTNSQMEQYLVEADKCAQEVRGFQGDMRALREQIESALKSPLFNALPVINDRIAKLERLAAEVRKYVVNG